MKKYMQLLLSVNFCLTAIGIANLTDSTDSYDFVLLDNEDASPFLSNAEEARINSPFNQIWDKLAEFNQISQYQWLQDLIWQHQENITQRPFEYNEEISEEAIEFELSRLNQATFLENMQTLYASVLSEEETRQEEQVQLDNQLRDITDCFHQAKADLELAISSSSFSKKEKALLIYQFKELEVFSIGTKLGDQINQIWKSLSKINAIYPYQSLENRLLEHQESAARPFQYDREAPEQSFEFEINRLLTESERHLNHVQTSFYEPDRPYAKGVTEEQDAEIDKQFREIKSCFDEIHHTYQPKLLQKKEKAFLSYQLQELNAFSENFVSEILDDLESTEDDSLVSPEQARLNEVRDLLNSCQEENALIYAEREPIINSKEVETEDFLTSPRSRLLYINRNEGLIEINHKEKDTGDRYTTIWKMRQADASLIKDWNEHDTITISKTGIFSKYSIYGEKLEYTLSNGKTSVRANLLCESTKQNTYTLLDIDYSGNAVILENGLCLFGASDENFEGWYVKDQVVLRRLNASLNTKAFHKLINTTRNKKNRVSVRQQ